jgi:hypothetical protein
MNYQFSTLFFSLLTDIHLIFGTLFCHTKLQIKFEFGFNPLEFHEVMAHGLKIIHVLQIVSSLLFCRNTHTPPTGFAVSDSYKSKFSLVMFELFWLNISPVGDLVLLAILSKCLFTMFSRRIFISSVQKIDNICDVHCLCCYQIWGEKSKVKCTGHRSRNMLSRL